MFILLIILLLLSLLLYYPLEVHTHFRRKAADDLLLIEIVLIPNYWIHRIEIPIIELESGKVPSLKVKAEVENAGNDDTLLEGEGKLDISWANIRHVIEHIHPYYKLLRCYFQSGKKLFRPWILKSFTWNTNFGTGDAALTGMAGGVLWSVKGLVWQQLTFIFNTPQKPTFRVNPDFYKRKLEMEIDGIFACRLGNIIIAAFKAWMNLRGCRRKE